MLRLFFLVCLGWYGYAQKYPTDYFQSPLDINLYLSGNFGELRSNHFHSGLDFATYGKEGYNVYAAAQGYVSRIKVSPFGYGKALYITHPNGYTTVYAHLQRYNSKIDNYVKQQQYQQKTFEIELFPKPSEFPINKGEIIALSGNSGGSEGPHLHFEIRNTQTEQIINPFHFGFDALIYDTEKPQLYSVMAYPMDKSSIVNGSQQPYLIAISQQNDSTFVASPLQVTGSVAFGIQTNDYQTKKGNKNGVYSLKTYKNDTFIYGCAFDIFAFDETRYINNFIDYQRYITTWQKYQRMFYKYKYPLSLISSNAQNGILTLQPSEECMYTIEVSDFHKNKVKVRIPVKEVQQTVTIPKSETKGDYWVRHNVENIFEKENIEVYFPLGSVYDDFYLNFQVNKGVLTLGTKTVPIHNAISIKFDVSAYTEQQRKKMCIASLNGKKTDYITTRKSEKIFTGKIRSFGTFTLTTDTLAPKIAYFNLPKNKPLTYQKTLTVKITDDQSGINTYNGYLNGQWILMEYDAKNDKLIYEIDSKQLISGTNNLKVIVTDNCDNSATFETNFLATP